MLSRISTRPLCSRKITIPRAGARCATVSRPVLPKRHTNDARSLTIATGIVTSWSCVLHHALTAVSLTSPSLDAFATFAALEFLYTGVFITGHDAVHGSVCARSPALNDAVGRLCFAAYAWFDYDDLRRNHGKHHSHPGEEGRDPDYRSRECDGFWAWYMMFMRTYLKPAQFAKLVAWTTALVAAGVDYENVVVFVALAPILSSLRLFAFGTYAPHADGARGVIGSADTHPLQSFLTCFHFDYHEEHHAFPDVPWWDLARVKREPREL
jgi:beta-carotene/zeaxanthin 4-ketolase